MLKERLALSSLSSSLAMSGEAAKGKWIGWWRPGQRTGPHADPAGPLCQVIPCFEPLFQQRSWQQAEALLAGAILASDQRTMVSIV